MGSKFPEPLPTGVFLRADPGLLGILNLSRSLNQLKLFSNRLNCFKRGVPIWLQWRQAGVFLPLVAIIKIYVNTCLVSKRSVKIYKPFHYLLIPTDCSPLFTSLEAHPVTITQSYFRVHEYSQSSCLLLKRGHNHKYGVSNITGFAFIFNICGLGHHCCISTFRVSFPLSAFSLP